MDPLSIFNLVIYQPFFNLLLGIYWGLGFFSSTGQAPDMGVAVIILTLIIRVLLLPLSLSAHESEADRRRIAAELQEIEEKYANQPEAFQKARKKIFKKDRKVLISELLSLLVQVTTALMLWRMFGSGLVGKDLHLVYDFMPEIAFPYNMMFLGRYDLSHASLTLNLVQSLSIFVLETISITTSPYPAKRGEVVRLQLFLPLVSFIIFMGLPAGKKLFVIVTLWFSIVLTTARAVLRAFGVYKEKKLAVDETESDELAPTSQEELVVDVK